MRCDIAPAFFNPRQDRTMHSIFFMLALTLGLFTGCAEESADECHSDDDCPEEQTCVISHDHEGDDHDHGGTCEAPDTAG